MSWVRIPSSALNKKACSCRPFSFLDWIRENQTNFLIPGTCFKIRPRPKAQSVTTAANTKFDAHGPITGLSESIRIGLKLRRKRFSVSITTNVAAPHFAIMFPTPLPTVFFSKKCLDNEYTAMHGIGKNAENTTTDSPCPVATSELKIAIRHTASANSIATAANANRFRPI